MSKSNDALFERAQQVIPGGVSSPVRAFRAVGGTPRFIVRGEGPRVWDAEGKAYLDYVLSWGPLIAGHAHPSVVEAVSRAARGGLSFGMPTEAEIELAELIRTVVPSLERLRFTSSGTEATMSALRLARGFTGRSRIIKFEGCYHGHADALLVKAGSGLLTFGNPSSAGVPAEAAQHTLVLDFNNVAQLEETFALEGDQIGAVIVEAVAGNMNLVPGSAAFLQALRRLCSQYGSVLIFDEVMTGFRVHPGGAQALYGITPDLTTFGKVIGGGMPVGVFGGRKDIMQCVAPLGPVYQAGTLSGNPVAMAAGLATLNLTLAPGFHEGLARATQRLVDGFNAIGRDLGGRISAACVGSMFGLYFSPTAPADFAQVMTADRDGFNAFFHRMLDQGVHLAPSAFEAGFLSSTHTDADIDATIAAARKALEPAG